MPLRRLPAFLVFAVTFFIFLPAWAEEGSKERPRLVLGSFSLVDMRPVDGPDWSGTHLNWGAETIDAPATAGPGASFGYIGMQWELHIGEDWTAYAAFAPGLSDMSGNGHGFNLRMAVGGSYAFDNGWKIGLAVPGAPAGETEDHTPMVESVLFNFSVPFE